MGCKAKKGHAPIYETCKAQANGLQKTKRVCRMDFNVKEQINTLMKTNREI